MTTPPDPNQPGGPEGTPPPYGAPPPAGQPYGAPPPAGQPYGAPPPGYGQPPAYGQQYGAAPAGYAGPPGQLAGWGERVLGYLVDYVGPYIVAVFVYVAINSLLGRLLGLASLAWGLYNGYLQGQTGQSYGKRAAGTRLISATTGQHIGGGMGVLRFITHIIDGLACGLGFLWPLWDSKKQTFADKIIGTVVLKV